MPTGRRGLYHSYINLDRMLESVSLTAVHRHSPWAIALTSHLLIHNVLRRGWFLAFGRRNPADVRFQQRRGDPSVSPTPARRRHQCRTDAGFPPSPEIANWRRADTAAGVAPTPSLSMSKPMPPSSRHAGGTANFGLYPNSRNGDHRAMAIGTTSPSKPYDRVFIDDEEQAILAQLPSYRPFEASSSMS
jgi:hypothetical protein